MSIYEDATLNCSTANTKRTTTMFEFAIAKMLHSFTTNIKNINISPTYKNPNVVKFENNIHWLFSNPCPSNICKFE